MEPRASSPRAVPRIVVVVVGEKVQEEQKRRSDPSRFQSKPRKHADIKIRSAACAAPRSNRRAARGRRKATSAIVVACRRRAPE